MTTLHELKSTKVSGLRRWRPSFFSRLRVRLLFLVFLALSPVVGLVIYTAIEQRASAIWEAKASALRMVRLAATGQKQHIEAGR